MLSTYPASRSVVLHRQVEAFIEFASAEQVAGLTFCRWTEGGACQDRLPVTVSGRFVHFDLGLTMDNADTFAEVRPVADFFFFSSHE